jgi:hypothetical protein
MNFPYSNFLHRIDDKKEKKVCWFEHRDQAEHYIKRHKLKKKDYVLTSKNEIILEPDPT